jgi:hypothetical protein
MGMKIYDNRYRLSPEHPHAKSRANRHQPVSIPATAAGMACRLLCFIGSNNLIDFQIRSLYYGRKQGIHTAKRRQTMKTKKTQNPKRRKITFQYENAGAQQVILVGDFNEWNVKKHPMISDGKGRWEKNILLIPGTYEYKFIVDGHWKRDPGNKEYCANSFGTSNSVLRVNPK